MTPWGEQTFARRIPANPKYADVKAVVCTGPTVRKVDVMTDKELSRRRQEMFGRISAAQLAKLMDREKDGETVFDLFDENRRGE